MDFAGRLQYLFNERFGENGLTISAALAVVKPKFPIRLAAQQAEEFLVQAKTEHAPRAITSKDQFAALGSLWKWQDHDRIVSAGKQLANWVDDKVIQRGWLNTLLELVLLRRGEAGVKYANVNPAVATSRLAYHIGRNWPKPRRRDDPPPPARVWIDTILHEFDQYDTTSHIETIHLPAIVRYAMLATRTREGRKKHEPI